MVYKLSDGWLAGALRDIERAQGNPSASLEWVAKQNLQTIGMVLASGGELSDDVRRWLGNILLDISKGKNPKQALCLSRPARRRHRRWTYDFAVNTEALCLLGMAQTPAAGLVCEFLGATNTDTSTAVKAHNQLRNREGLFKSLGKTSLKVLIPHEVTFGPDSPEIIYPEIDDISSPEGAAEIYRRRREQAGRFNGYVYYDVITVPPDPPEKIILSDHDHVSLELLFPGEVRSYMVHEKLLAKLRKELRPKTATRVKR